MLSFTFTGATFIYILHFEDFFLHILNRGFWSWPLNGIRDVRKTKGVEIMYESSFGSRVRGALLSGGIGLLSLLATAIGCADSPEKTCVQDSRSPVVHLMDIDGGSPDGGSSDDSVWLEQTKLLPLDGSELDVFGWSVSLSGDSALVGAPMDQNNTGFRGSAYVFVTSGDSWVEQQKLLPSDAPDGSQFAWSVSISGDTAMVCATGSVYVFVRTGDTWQEHQKLEPSDGVLGFGGSIFVDGSFAIVGAAGDNENGTSSGSAYIFERSGDTWQERQKLLPSDGVAGGYFGQSVSLGGDYALVGAVDRWGYGTTTGSAYVFERSGDTWEERQKFVPSSDDDEIYFGYTVSISENTAMIGAYGDDAVYVYERSGSVWEESQGLTASDGEYGDWFGISVSLKDDTALVGSLVNEDKGAAYVFVRNGDTWEESQKLKSSDLDYGDTFGHIVSLSDDTLIITAPQNDDNGDSSGSVYIFQPGAPVGIGEPCASDVQCMSSYCVDGVCCDEACGGNNLNDCEACSLNFGATQDGICSDLDGTFCSDDDATTFDDFCVMGTCEGTPYGGDSDPGTEADAGGGDEAECSENGGSCGCDSVGRPAPSGLLRILIDVFDSVWLEESGQC